MRLPEDSQKPKEHSKYGLVAIRNLFKTLSSLTVNKRKLRRSTLLLSAACFDYPNSRIVVITPVDVAASAE